MQLKFESSSRGRLFAAFAQDSGLQIGGLLGQSRFNCIKTKRIGFATRRPPLGGRFPLGDGLRLAVDFAWWTGLDCGGALLGGGILLEQRCRRRQVVVPSAWQLLKRFAIARSWNACSPCALAPNTRRASPVRHAGPVPYITKEGVSQAGPLFGMHIRRKGV